MYNNWYRPWRGQEPPEQGMLDDLLDIAISCLLFLAIVFGLAYGGAWGLDHVFGTHLADGLIAWVQGLTSGG